MRAHGVGWMLVLAACSFGEPPVADPGDVHVPEDGPEPGAGVVEAPGERPALAVAGVPGASGVLIPGEDGVFLVADVDAGAVLRLSGLDAPDGATAVSAAVGAEPTRLVRRGATVWATLRAQGQLVRLRDTGSGLVEEDRVDVGTEPFDVVASPFADRLYVSLSQEDVVLALDARTLEEVGRWSVPGEPRDLVMLPDAGDGLERVAVASGRRATVTVIQPVTGTRVEHTIPVPQVFDPNTGAPLAPLLPRISGDLAVDGQGRVLAPVVLADTDLRERPTAPPPEDAPDRPSGGQTTEDPAANEDTFLGFPGEVPGDTGRGGGGCEDVGGGAYGQPVDPACKDPGSVGRFTPVVVRLDLAVGSFDPAAFFALGSVVDRTERVARGYPSAVGVAQDPALGEVVWVSMPTEDALVVFAPEQAPRSDSSSDVMGENAGDFQKDPSGLRFAPRLALPAEGGPVGLVPLGDAPGVVTWALHDRVLARTEGLSAGFAEALMRGERLAFPAVQATWARVEGGLAPELAEGRRHFMSAMDARMAAVGSGVSCDTCHVDGRNDGLTWIFEDMPRQTPNLAGRVSDTLPITWLGAVATVADEVVETTTKRMGGEGMTSDLATAVARFVDHGRPILRPQPRTEAERAQVARGAALFASPDVGCASCHAGAASTDGWNWKVAGFDLATNTPTLRGIGGSAPYFHDGSATTLRDVLLRARDGSMGTTRGLDEDELDALEAYLRTL